MSETNRKAERPDTEALILKAAEEEFLNKGFDGARTTSIAERAGVSHAMLHYYFRSKEKLFDTVLETKTSEMRGVMFGFIDDSTRPLQERIEESMRRHFEYLAHNPRLPLFVINELNRENSKVLKHLHFNQEMAGRIFSSLQADVDAAADKGECRRLDARALLIDIISLNVFAFVGLPLFESLLKDVGGRREAFLKGRLEENISTIKARLQP